MSENKYTVTLKTAGMRSRYINESDEIKHSAMGHMWYELQQNNGDINSFGFQPVDDPDDEKILLSILITIKNDLIIINMFTCLIIAVTYYLNRIM